MRTRLGAWGVRPGARVAFAALALVLSAGCRQDMHDQPKVRPLRPSTFFADGSSARPLVDDTVARGQLRTDAHLVLGRVANQLADTFPFPVTRELLDRGEERFEIFCTPCHGRAGDGDGMVVRRGLRRPPSWHTDRLRQMPVGHFFDVMTNGFGVMQDYRSQIPVHDRWAIAAYIRVLQLSQHAGLDDVPASERGQLDRPDAGRPAQESHR